MFKKQGGGVGLSQTPTSHSQKEGKSSISFSFHQV